MGFPLRARVVALSVFGALACATASATTLSATLLDPKDAPAFVSSCSIDNDSSGVFTPAIVVSDRKPSAVTSADVAIDFFDAQNRPLGEVVVAAPYAPQGLPFGSIDRVGCRIKRAQFLDGSVYEVKDRSTTSNAIAPIAGAILGIGAAAILIGSNKGGGAKGSSTPGASPTPNPSTSSTPVPVASIVPLARPKKPH